MSYPEARAPYVGAKVFVKLQGSPEVVVGLVSFVYPKKESGINVMCVHPSYATPSPFQHIFEDPTLEKPNHWAWPEALGMTGEDGLLERVEALERQVSQLATCCERDDDDEVIETRLEDASGDVG